MTGWQAACGGVTMGGMTMTADLADLLVRVVREQRRRRDWPRYDESAASRAEDGASGGTEQDPQRRA